MASNLKKFFSLVFFLLLFKIAEAQNIEFAREVINELCSPNMHGRGFVNKGDSVAAAYISSQFKSMGIEPVQESYIQSFNISVNSLPGDMELILDGKLLVAGKDYLADPCSPGLSGNFQILELNADILNDQKKLQIQLSRSKGKFLLVNKILFKNETKEQAQKLNQVINILKQSNDNPASGIIIITDEKLTWHVSGDVCNIPAFTVYKPGFSGKVKKIKLAVENRFYPQYQTQNVIGILPGKTISDSVIVFSAHYDHLGRMGRDTFFPGANDNASGMAMLLNLARHYSSLENRLEYSLVFMAFGAEEAGLLGSRYYVENPLFDLERIKFLINLDIAGTGDEGITVVNGKVYTEAFDLLVKINEEEKLLPKINSRGEACNSDHCFFHRNKVPSFFIYTLGGIQAYHDVYDIPETLPLTFYNEYFKLITSFVSALNSPQASLR
ncbi:hypothetical protein BH23BAC1_BH23BAC1_37220 [soil metagenome]